MVRAARLAAFAALAVLIPACATSRRTGEVEVFKIAPSDATPRADRTSGTYLLKGRFFSLSDNSNRILDAFQEFDHVGALRILKECDRVREEALRSAGRSDAGGDASPAEIARLRKIADRAHALHDRLARKIGVFDPAADLIRIGPYTVLEMSFERYVDRLDCTRRFLDYLRDSVEDIRRELKRPLFPGSPRFEIIFEVAGAPLVRDAWNPADAEKGHRLNPTVYNMLYRRLSEPLEALFKSLNDIPRLDRPRYLVQETESIRAANDQLKIQLQRILEWALDMSYATRKERTRIKVRKDGKDADPPLEYDFERHLDLLNIEIQKALGEIRVVLEALREPLRQIASTFIAERVEIEGMAVEVAQVTRRNFSRPIVVPKAEGASAPHLTVILKTLFVRFLEEGLSDVEPQERCAELLVTCAVKHGGNAEDAVYPLIFEKEFAPGHFVNRHDRIAYGPYPYQGEFLDFRLSVVELDDLDNAAIMNGIANATAAVGAFNPELAVLSPAVTAIFGTLIRELSENDTELDASFTFPGQQGMGKPNVDMMLNETGHYVVLKRENSSRRERLDMADQELLYRKLIYNAEDGKLYWRRSFSDARANFIPDNLFKQQTYAVFVITDEYTRGDELGASLRKQVGRALGEARAREIVPDLAQSAKLLQRYHDLRKDKRQFRESNLSEVDRKTEGKKIADQQEELWKDSTELQKQLLIEALYDQASEDAKARLGKDLEKWKRAEFDVDSLGRLHLRTEAVTLDERRVKAPGPSTDQSFVTPVKDGRTWTYQLLADDGRVLPAATATTTSSWEGLGGINHEGLYTSPGKPTTPWVIVRAVGTAEGRQDQVLQRKVSFTNDTFVKGKLSDGSGDLKEGSRGDPIVVVRTLLEEATLTLELVDSPAAMTWRVADKTVTKTAKWENSALAEAALDGKKLTLKLAAGRLAESSEEIPILTVMDPFFPLVERGTLELYPHLKASLRLVNPLSFDPGVAEIEVDLQGNPKQVRPVKAVIAGAAQDLKVEWSFKVGGASLGKITPAVPPGVLDLDPKWFKPILGNDATGTVDVEGTSDKGLRLRARLPYRSVILKP